MLRVEPEIAALGARIPLAACPEESTHAHPFRIAGPGVREVGCMDRTRIHYVVIRDEKPVLLSSPDALRGAYAPIGSAAEAAGLVVALRGAALRYEPSKEYLPLVDAVEDAFAEAAANGFRVHLFESQSCGCGAHRRYGVDYAVSRDAAVSVENRKPIDEIPAGRRCDD
jgi:hypothetical protein